MIRQWLVMCALCASASGQTTTWLSAGAGGVQGNGHSADPSISADGRYVAFDSRATNLVPGGTSGWDAFVHDRMNGTTTRVSVSSSGVPGNGYSEGPTISADGRYVAYTSLASNLVPGDTNATWDIFVYDRVSASTTRASVASNGAQANFGSLHQSISADGRYVAFHSSADNLVPGDTNSALDVFVHDMVSGSTTRVSVDSNGIQGNATSGSPTISPNGRYVAFGSVASNLVPGDTNGVDDLFVHDMLSGATTRVSVDSSGLQGNGFSGGAAFSFDGRYVAFHSEASNLVPGDTNNARDVFVHDMVSGTTTRVSVDSDGIQGNNASSIYQLSISSDGRFVAFESDATNLVSGDTNSLTDIFLHDMLTSATTIVSVNSGGAQGDGESDIPTISSDGRYVAFQSLATNFVPGDTNAFADIYVRDRGPASAYTSMCFGDGTGGACPCSNSGSSSHGCENSAATGGALLMAAGVASLSADSVQLSSSSELPTALSIVLQGSSVIAPVNFGDGLRCAGGNLKRLYTKHAIGGGITAPQVGDPSISARSATLGDSIPLGATRAYQVYYRDPNLGFCPGGFNVSSAIVIAWGA